MSRALAIDKDGRLTYEKRGHKYSAKAVRACTLCCRMVGQGSTICGDCRSDTIKRFASTREYGRFTELKLAEKAGLIRNLKLQPRYKMPPGFTYVSDFEYLDNGRHVAEDSKGMETPEFKLKAKCFRYFYPHIELRITK